MTLPTIDTNYFTKFLVDLLNIASPMGFAEPAIAVVEKELSQYKQLELSRTRKGGLVAKWENIVDAKTAKELAKGEVIMVTYDY